jgi:FtsH-binding integral membrane protein
MFVAN